MKEETVSCVPTYHLPNSREHPQKVGYGIFPNSATFFGANLYEASEWFSEPESARIRSAVKFCVDLDVRKKFQLIRIFFSVDPKMGT